MPFGFGGVMAGAAQVFFAYLGFDAVAASAAEVKNPSRNMPRGIIGTLMICTVLYMLVSVVLTGMVSYRKLDVADPVAFALHAVNQNWFAGVLSVGALAGMFYDDGFDDFQFFKADLLDRARWTAAEVSRPDQREDQNAGTQHGCGNDCYCLDGRIRFVGSVDQSG